MSGVTIKSLSPADDNATALMAWLEKGAFDGQYSLLQYAILCVSSLTPFLPALEKKIVCLIGLFVFIVSHSILA